MIEGLQINIPQRLSLVRVVLTVSLVVSVVLSFNLWGGYRSFPYSPVIDDLKINAPYDLILVIINISLWLLSLFVRRHRLFIFLAILLNVLLILGDINRLQPWFYVYNAMMLVFVFYSGRVDDSNHFTGHFILLQIIFASVYFFCGISQLNPYFITTDFVEIISPLKQICSERQFLFLIKMGLFAPYLLIFTGIGLIIPALRYLAITLAILIHLFLLVMLFPSTQQSNYALWFSNLSFAVMAVFLFSGKTKQRYFSFTYLFKMPLFYPVLLFFVLLPFFNKGGFWPDYLSSNFKSGSNKSLQININQNIYEKLPLYQRSYCLSKNSQIIFAYNRWCSHELKVECYPSEPVFNSIYGYLRKVEKLKVNEIELAYQGR